MDQGKKRVDRRKFLAGLLTGGGAVAALTTRPPQVTAAKDAAAKTAESVGPILYRRTPEAERYYRTLYS